MKPSIEDNAKGKLHEVKGAIKKEIGKVTNDPELQADGTSEEIAGKVEQVIAKIENVVGK